MLTVVKSFEFESAHHLEDYEGACANVHGHSYKLHVGVSTVSEGIGVSSTGFVVDFRVLKQVVHRRVITVLDHADLNEVFDFNPSAERMIVWMKKTLEEHLPNGIVLQMIRLYETSSSYAEWRR